MLLGCLLLAARMPDYRAAVINAPSDGEKGAAYSHLFEHSKVADLAIFQKDADTGIALQAAWEKARVPMRKNRGPRRIGWTYDPARTTQFIKFFGERTGVAPPDWWKRIFLDIDLFPRQHHACVGGSGPSADYTVAKAPDHWTISQNGRSLTFTRAYFNGTPEVRTLALEIGSDRAFVAPHDYGGGGRGFRLRCLDSRTGNELWRTPVWGSGRKFIAGFSPHNVSLVREGNVIVVFGSESHSAYAEGFAVMDGHSLFRFNSCYWFNFPETWKVPWSKQPPEAWH